MKARIACSAAIAVAMLATGAAPATGTGTGICAMMFAPLSLFGGLYYYRYVHSYPFLGPAGYAQGSFTTNFGPTCMITVTLSDAYCYSAQGYGSVLDSSGGTSSISVIWDAAGMHVSGGFTGTLRLDQAPGESCVYPDSGWGADTWLVTGSLVGT